MASETRKLLLIGLALLAGCAKDPAPGGGNLPTTNPEVPVDVLLEVDGCRVYRFYDGGRAHYFVTPGGTTIASYTENCGKNCNRTVIKELQTARRP